MARAAKNTARWKNRKAGERALRYRFPPERGFIRRPGSTTHLFGPDVAGRKSRLWVDPRLREGDNERVADVAQGLRSGPAALPAVRVLAAPHTR
jgi:hypothetical protein